MDKEKAKFYSHGKFFDNEKDFWSYSNEWPFQITNEEEFNRMWEHLGKDLWVNLYINKIEVNNGAMNDVLQENFLHLLQKFIYEKIEKLKT